MQRRAHLVIRRALKMLSNAYFLAKFRFDTAENKPAKNLQKKIAKFANFAYLVKRARGWRSPARGPRGPAPAADRGAFRGRRGPRRGAAGSRRRGASRGPFCGSIFTKSMTTFFAEILRSERCKSMRIL